MKRDFEKSNKNNSKMAKFKNNFIDKKSLLIFIVLVVTGMGFLHYSYLRSKKDSCLMQIDGVIGKVDYTPQAVMIITVNESNYYLRPFRIRKGEDIRIGDSIVKPKCHSYLKVYRKNDVGDYENINNYSFIHSCKEHCP